MSSRAWKFFQRGTHHDASDNSEDLSSLLGRLNSKSEGLTMRVKLLRWLGLVVCTGLLLIAVVHAVQSGRRHVGQSAPPTLTSALKPGYHITAKKGWLNDPNGMMYYNGLLHVFYQLNPFAPRWAAPWWGHVVSRDFAHWQRLPPALAPETWFDGDGVFSGSAVLDDKGLPRLLYTGVNFTANKSHPLSSYFYQRQAWAVPVDPQDVFLTNWTRPESSNPLPMPLPPGGTPSQFRDPVTPWTVPWQQIRSALAAEAKTEKAQNLGAIFGKEYGSGPESADLPVWLTAVGVQDDCIGAAALYASPDLENWAYAGTLFSQLSQNLSRYDVCMLSAAQDVPPGARSFGSGVTECDQFGADCHMWECPDFFNVTQSIYAFKYSDQVKLRPKFSGDWYVLGEVLNYSAAVLQDGNDAFRAELGGQPYEPMVTDYGSVYASKSFQVGSRRLWLGWIFEDAVGCATMCGDGSRFTEQLGWQGAQTLLRQVEYDPESQRLRFFPIAETVQLRQATLFAGQLALGSSYTAPESPLLLNLSRSSGTPSHRDRKTAAPQQHNTGNRQLEIVANFSIVCRDREACDSVPPTWSFELGVVIRTGKDRSYTTIMLRGSGKRSSSNPAGLGSTSDLSILVDKKRSGGATRAEIQGGTVDASANGHKVDNLELRAFVDRSIVESYAMQGRGRVTSRIYPLDSISLWDVGLYGNVVLGPSLSSSPQAPQGVSVMVNAEVYTIGDCWVQHA